MKNAMIANLAGLFLALQGLGCSGTPPPAENATLKVFLVEIRENMGCVVRRNIVQDLSEALQSREAERNSISIVPAEIASEDASQTKALYFFAPFRVGNHSAYLAIEVIPEGGPDALFEVTQADWRPDSNRFSFKTRGTARARSRVYFAADFKQQNTYANCPDAEDQTMPVAAPDWALYPLESVPQAEIAPYRNWTLTQLHSDEFVLKEWRDLARCWETLEVLNQTFGSKQTAFAWKTTETGLTDTLRAYLKRSAPALSVDLRSQGRIQNLARDANFPPQLRQRVWIRDNGAIRPYEIRIRNDE